jgi:anti-sigma B factor antagonist
MCDIRAQEENGVLMLDISGRLTILDQHLRSTVSRFLRAGRRQFVLRMKDVSYIDSCGLGELVSVYTSIRSSGGHMRLLNPSERVRELLSTTRLDTIFEITEERSDSTVYGCASADLGYSI